MSGEDLVREHWGLARHAAAKVARRGRDFDDAFSDALLGLWVAVLTHRPDRGRFGAHAGMCITRAMIDGVRHRKGRLGTARHRALSGMRSLDEVLARGGC